ncbi:hypothetical protein GR248_01495 [Rhizobium leguminosarum]|uniref:super-infection exclusion protein B n=1 Tax=Rhizobium leguminosarum TaxID=384 RepID=UPI0013CADA6F|nr:super-infection exclusion protein B [Rhizobium leguminosarum]NEI89482.1 hypothetical protein [Rhizobium leguminosarum]
MPEWLTNIFSLTREISSKVATPIFVTTGLILFLPDDIASTLGIDELRHTFRTWIGFFFLFSAAALAVNFVWMIAAILKPPIRDFIFIQLNNSTLRTLLENEKAVLRPFIHDGEASIHGNVNDGTINLLEHKRLIARSSSISIRYTIFPFILQPWVREYLTKHPELLD